MNGIVASHLDEIAELCRRFGVQRLEVFGSGALANPETVPQDIDFLVFLSC